MKIRMNQVMRDALDRYKIQDISELELENVNIFQEIISLGFSVDRGCVLLKKNLGRCKGVEIESFPDLTGYECYINKINVDDFLASSDPKDLLRTSLFVTRLLDSELAKLGVKIQIILGLQVDDVSTSSVRFHRVRDNESWLNANLENYDEWVFVAEIN